MSRYLGANPRCGGAGIGCNSRVQATAKVELREAAKAAAAAAATAGMLRCNGELGQVKPTPDFVLSAVLNPNVLQGPHHGFPCWYFRTNGT